MSEYIEIKVKIILKVKYQCIFCNKSYYATTNSIEKYEFNQNIILNLCASKVLYINLNPVYTPVL